MSYLGLDIGTGACKAVIFSSEGREIATASREYPLLHPHPGHAELDSEEVIRKCKEVISEVNGLTTDPVVAMSISSQGEAFTPVDTEGNILGNAMVSSDTRADAIANTWSHDFGIDRIYRITGHTPHPLFSLFKILWIKAHQPEVWEKARYFLCFEDLFHHRMGLEPKISWSLAGRTMLFDVIRHTWSQPVLDEAGLSAERLAVPVAPGEITGMIPTEMGHSMGFRDPVALVSGGHDQPVAALGAGVIETGMCMYATGSVECFCPMLETPSFSTELRENNLNCFDYSIKGKYTSLAYSLTGGNILRWMRDQLGQYEMEEAARSDRNAYTLLLDSMPAEPTDLLVLPYFSPSGTPYFDTRATGAILGLKLTTTKGEITRALLEGVALEMKLNLSLMENSGMRIEKLVATGGGTKHKAWTQLKADVLNKGITVRKITEAGCYGAALLAQSALSGMPVSTLVRQNEIESEMFSPEPGNAAIYERIYENYRRLYHGLKPFRND